MLIHGLKKVYRIDLDSREWSMRISRSQRDSCRLNKGHKNSPI